MTAFDAWRPKSCVIVEGRERLKRQAGRNSVSLTFQAILSSYVSHVAVQVGPDLLPVVEAVRGHLGAQLAHGFRLVRPCESELVDGGHGGLVVGVLPDHAEPELGAHITDDQLAEAVDLTMDFLRRAIGTGSTEGADLDLDGWLASVENEQ